MAENQTQQRDPDVVTYSAFSGLRNDIAPERFSPSDLTIGNNVDLDKSGYLARRAGYTRQWSGAAHSLWSDPTGTLCFFVTNGQLTQLNADYTTRGLATVANLPMSFMRVNDRVYFSNGLNTGVIENGAVRSWGLPVPSLPNIVTTVGQMPAGTYLFTCTYMRGDGQESGAPLAGSFTVPDGSGVIFTLTAPTDPAVAFTQIYLSTPNGEVMYWVGMLPAGTTSFTYTDSTGPMDLPLNTQFLGPAPAGQLVAYYRGMTFVAAGDTLYPSEPFAHELFDLRKYISLDGRITMIAPLTDREMYETGKNSGLFIGTDRSCGVLVGSGPGEFQYVPKANYGAVEGALTFVDGSVFGDDSQGMRELPMWLTTQGICVGLPEMVVRNLTRTKYQFAVTGRGAALFMPGPNRLIFSDNL